MRDAVGFLTVLPVRAGPPRRRSVALFPLVGLVVGAGWALAGGAGGWLGGPLLAAALVLTVDLLLTGGLHLDGLADTADGLASRRPPEQAREVMKDPRVGAVGAATLATALLLRFALVAAVATEPAGAGLPLLAVAPVVGRAALVWLLAVARPEPGSLSAGPVAAARGWPVAVATVLAAGLVAALAGPAAVLAGAAAVALSGLVTQGWWSRRLGSSGDTLGAGGLLAELGTLVGVLALPSGLLTPGLAGLLG